MRLAIVVLLCALATPAGADVALPEPLRVADVVALARARRPEIAAARARARGAAERPAIVAALEDPSVSASIDHLPFHLMGVDGSLVVEQRFPLSRVRGHRERAARAAARRERANADRVTLDAELDAAAAFWELAGARAGVEILERQHALATQLVSAATARYTANAGTQAEILRAQIEVSRLAAERRALTAEIRAAEVMLNTSLARDADAVVPALDATVLDELPPAPATLAGTARRRPELRAGAAELESAQAEVSVMQSMYAPMAMVRTGPSYTMAEGTGWMVMVGVSIPLWRGKLRAGVAEAEAMAAVAQADLEATQRMIDGQARRAREEVAAARERYVALRDEIVPRAGQAIAPTLAAYASGQVPLVSVVEAAQALWMAERELVVARAELGAAWARLRRATGEDHTR